MIVCGDARHIPLADDSVQCVVTSPPYWGLRKYAGEQELQWGGREDCEHEFTDQSVIISEAVGNWQQAENGPGLVSGVPQTRFRGDTAVAGKRKEATIYRATCSLCGAWRGAFGLEPTVEMYAQHTVEILREIRRGLRSDGVVFWNIGDSYARDAAKGPHKPGDAGIQNYIIERGGGRAANEVYLDSESKGSSDGFLGHADRAPVRVGSNGLKPKDLCLIPQRIALAAQADGWWVRSDIIWAKPNPMPESVRDRPTDAYDHILMLTKSAKYFWDAEAVMGPLKKSSLERDYSPAYFDGVEAPKMLSAPKEVRAKANWRANPYIPTGRNLRNVWTFPTQPMGAYWCEQCRAVFPNRRGFPSRKVVDDEGRERTEIQCPSCKAWDNWGSHFATFPEELPRRCIKAATKPGALVLDPFAGSGTVGRVAIELGRVPVLLDLAYHDFAAARLCGIQRDLIFV